MKTVKFEILIEGLKITVVWYVMPYSLVDECKSFLGTSYYPEHGDNRYVRNLGIIYQTV
jgi:hypothetical protein